MAIGFLPGEPNGTPTSCSFVNWNTIQILAYTSGNNLVILTKNSTHLQTIYLPTDSYVVDVNRINGKIAIAINNQIYVYSPQISNFYNFNFHGRKNLDELKIEWKLEYTITNENDTSEINCLSWSDYTEIADSNLDSQFMDLPPEFNPKTLCEIVAGSNNSLTMYQLSYVLENNEKSMKCDLIWHKIQPNPIYKVKFSPNATCIASIGYYDNNVKLWNRIGFTTDFCDFELRYILHDTCVTDIIWKDYMALSDVKNSDDSKSASVQLTPSNSFVLKPTNSIYKNDPRFANLETNSIYSDSTKESQHNVLYTITDDSLLNVYSTYRLDRGFEVFNSGNLDLFESDPSKRDTGIIKSVVFIDNPYIELGLEKLLNDLEIENTLLRLDDSLRKQNKLSDYLRSQCELCMVIGNDGCVDLYAFGNLCSPSPINMSIFRINKFSQNGQTFKTDIFMGKYCLPSIPKTIFLKTIQINHYSDNLALTLVIHDAFKNTIREVGFTFDEIFEFEKENLFKDKKRQLQSKKKYIGSLQQKFTGHNKSVRRLIKSTDGSSILSVTRFNENYLWFPIYLNQSSSTLTKKSIIVTPSPVLNAAIWKSGTYVLTLLKDKLICYTTKNIEIGTMAKELCFLNINIPEDPECFFLLPESTSTKCHVIAIFSDGTCRSYELEIKEINNQIIHTLSECSISNLPVSNNDDLHIISAINPVGWERSIDKLGRDVLATVSKNGLVSIYYVTYSTSASTSKLENEIIWHLKDQFKTGIKNCSFISGSSVNKMAIIDESKTKLTIWDMKIGVMDYTEDFGCEFVKDLDWTSTNYDQSILAVGFKSYSLLYTQLRYDYTNRTLSFAKIKKVDISDQTTHEIGDSIWMKDGLLIIGAGNQLYLSDKKLDINHDIITSKAIGTLEIVSKDLFHLCSALNGPLPFYHPQFIIQLLLSGRHTLISKILVKLSNVLREIDLGKRKEDDFDLKISSFELLFDDDEFKSNKLESYNKLLGTDKPYDNEDIFDEQCATILIEKLQKMRLPFLSGHQQITLSHTVSIMKDILLKYLNVLDTNGLKFYLVMKLFLVNMGKEVMKNINQTIRMRDISFALHSDNKDLLYDIVNNQAGGRIDWLNAKRYGLPFWLESSKLKNMVEKVAANEFLKFQNENYGKKDPSSCSIFYLTLRKKQVLLGLWKNSFGHSERDKMIKFLSNDFSEKRWKSAALKNAYVLLGKHRYVDAASFFLLADSPKDAVHVIMRQLDDVALAVAVARCYDGVDNGPSMQVILERRMLTDAIISNNRWKLSWVFWILGDKPHAAQSLIKPLNYIQQDIEKLLPSYQWPNIDSVVSTGSTEDPVLLVMYSSLRNRNIAYHKGISNLKPEHEFLFVIKSATMYEKMGCDWLGLFLVKRWKFSEQDAGDKSASSNVSNEANTSTNQTERRKPGDILAKFMSSPQIHETSVKQRKSQATPNLLDAFMGTSNTTQPNALESFMTPLQNATVKQPANLLDSFEMERPAKKANLLDNFKDAPTRISSIKKDKSKKISATPNLLDNWA